MLKYAPLVLVILIVVGCGGGGGGGATPDPINTGSAIQVVVSPIQVTLQGGHSCQFSADVTGTTNTAVRWEVLERIDGGMVSSQGLYYAPSAPGTAHVRATSVADPTKEFTATITIIPGDDGSGGNGLTVSVSPAEVVLQPRETQQFTATVVGHSNQAVTWAVVEGSNGGTITADGLYTAPAETSTFPYHVMAISQADPTVHSTAIVDVIELPPIPLPP